MKKFFQNAFTKIKDYFTANTGCKIFFFGLVATAVCFVLYALTRAQFAYMATVFALVAAGVGTLWDSMLTRYNFLKRVREIQYEHLKEAYEKQAAGESVEITATFTDDEKRYIRRRKWGYIFTILFKVGLVIALFSLLLSM